MKPGIKVIITDLDGVIRHFPIERDREIELRFNLSTGSLARAAFEPVLLEKAITGKISDEEWRARILKKLTQQFPHAETASALREWSDFHGEIDQELVTYLKSLSGMMPLALLTNATSRLHADLAVAGIHDNFKIVFNSSELGMIKPNQKLFQHVCDHFGVLPEEALFIDDSKTNTSAAADLGLVSIHFTGLADLRSSVESLQNKKN